METSWVDGADLGGQRLGRRLCRRGAEMVAGALS